MLAGSFVGPWMRVFRVASQGHIFQSLCEDTDAVLTEVDFIVKAVKVDGRMMGKVDIWHGGTTTGGV